MFILKINTDEVVVFANKLEKLHKSALPIVIRQTLNTTAFDTKKIHLENVTSQEFPKRQKNFFKFFSMAETAKGLNINSMQSRMGIMPRGNQAAENLTQMERGGTIKNRDFLPTQLARVSSDKGKLVSRANKLAFLKSKNRAERVQGGNAQKFIIEAIKAGKGGSVIYDNVLYKISSTQRRGKNTFVKAKALYTFERGRSVSVSGTGFIRKSANLGAKNMPLVFKKHAEKRIIKLLKK